MLLDFLLSKVGTVVVQIVFDIAPVAETVPALP